MFDPVNFVVMIFAGLLAQGPVAPGVSAAECQNIASEDLCIDRGICDVFSVNGNASCQLACDFRTSQLSCEADAQCQWTSGACSYPQSVPGC